MRIAVTGASGFVGTALVPYLEAQGHEVLRLGRHPDPQDPKSALFLWSPEIQKIDLDRLEGVDAVIHLAGANIAKLWTEEQKTNIRDSRVLGTRFLCQKFTQLATPPKTLICASAYGYYGDRGAAILTEEEGPGEGFLASVCQSWEAATQIAVQQNIRVVNTRFGFILASQGGLLASMLPLFRQGMGGRLGSGQQYMSWITLADVLRILHLLCINDAFHGPINVTAPNPVTNGAFAASLGRVLNRPVLMRIPAFALKLLPGGMGQELFLFSTRAIPGKLQAAGYTFQYPELTAAFRHALEQEKPEPRLTARSTPVIQYIKRHPVRIMLLVSLPLLLFFRRRILLGRS